MLSRSFQTARNRIAIAIKAMLYGDRGEPYDVLGHRLRFPIGARPVRMHYVHSNDQLARQEALALAMLLTELCEGDTALDVGAHAGIYSVLMAHRCGKTGRVIAFEPDPAAAHLFKKTFDLNPNLKVPVFEPLACSDTRGPATFFASNADSRSSLAHGNRDNANAIEVQTVQLDDYLAEHNIAPPRLVKIDTEGAEIRVMRGARRLLEGPSTIICELHPFAWPRFEDSFEELLELVRNSGRCIRYLGGEAEVVQDPVYGLAVFAHV